MPSTSQPAVETLLVGRRGWLGGNPADEAGWAFDMNGREDGPDTGKESLTPLDAPSERTYSGDMVLLVLFFIIVAVLALLFFARSQVQ